MCACFCTISGVGPDEGNMLEAKLNEAAAVAGVRDVKLKESLADDDFGGNTASVDAK